jgi:polar amino acid transport system substrate-binding protein
MPELVRTGKIDIVLNGYEWTPERLTLMDASIPYYVYTLQLLARRGGEVRSWADLHSHAGADKWRVGVLGGSAAEAYLATHAGASVEIVSYDGATDAMREVETAKLDATLQDSPAASFYASRFPRLAKVEGAVGRGYYVVYARKGSLLIAGINSAIADMAQGGELEAIYRRYGLWNDEQTEVVEIASAGRFYRGTAYGTAATSPSPFAEPARPLKPRALGPTPRGLAVLSTYGTVLLRAAGLTALLSCVSFPLASALGLAVALGRLYGGRWIRVPLSGYVEFLRGTPLMLQLYFVFFVLPDVGINVPAFWTAVLGLAINYSAYESEIYRAGLSAVPRGQMEAALALGMSRPLALRRIIVPQAVRVVLPPAVNDFIALFKDTSVCSVITLVELTKRFSVLSQSTQATIELMIMTGLLYLTMSYPLSLIAQRIEQKLARGAR